MGCIVRASVDDRDFELVARRFGLDFAKESEKVAARTLRGAATRAWNRMRAQARLERVDRRSRVYVRRRRSVVGATLWLGIDQVPAHRLVGGYVTGVGRRTRIEGAAIPRVFRPRLGAPAFERQGRRPLPIDIYRVALAEEPIEQALGDVDEQYDLAVIRAVDKILEGSGA